MKYDIKQAFTYLFKDKKFAIKLTCFYILAIVALLCQCDFKNGTLHLSYNMFSFYFSTENIPKSILSMLSTIISIYFFGYFYANTNMRIYKSTEGLYEIKAWKNIMLSGIKSFFFYIMVLLFMAAITLLIPNLNTNGLIISIIGGFIGLLSMLLILACDSSFATDLKFTSFFNATKIKQILFKNFIPFLKYLGWGIIVGFVIITALAISVISIVGTLLVPFLIMYFYMIVSDLKAQLIQYAFVIKSDTQNAYTDLGETNA